MYTNTNFKTKKALKEAIAGGRQIGVFQPGPFGGSSVIPDGKVYLEGPHFPQAHSWYATGIVKGGILTGVK